MRCLFSDLKPCGLLILRLFGHACETTPHPEICSNLVNTSPCAHGSSLLAVPHNPRRRAKHVATSQAQAYMHAVRASVLPATQAVTQWHSKVALNSFCTGSGRTQSNSTTCGRTHHPQCSLSAMCTCTQRLCAFVPSQKYSASTDSSSCIQIPCGTTSHH